MGASFHLGRIAGVRIGVNWSVLVIFALIVGGLAAGRFPVAYPGAGAAAYVVTGLVTGVVFFASLLAHEMSHALVARRNGLEVDGITLWLFGGVARLSGEARSPGAELRIAGVGPLVSLVLGGAFLLVTALVAATGYDGLALAALGWLGAINIALAVFNAIPAAPLDGGRLLRSVIWWRTGDPLRATVWASRAGQVFGFLLIGFGLVSLFTTGGLGGLWLALIGWFLVGAATVERDQAQVRGRLGGVAVREVMTPDPVTAPASMTVEDLLRDASIRGRHSSFPLADGAGPPVGLVTFTQVRAVAPEDRATTRLRDIGCPIEDVTQVGPDEPVAELLPRLSRCAQGRALVVADGRLVGILTPSDVSRSLQWADTVGAGPRAR